MSNDLIERISALRRAEDEAFSSAVGLARLELGLSEPALLGRTSRDFDGVEADVERLQEPMLSQLAEMAGGAERKPLFCPTGIGNHVNHLATLRVVADNYSQLASRYRIFFYEDIPYSRKPRDRVRGLQRLFSMVEGKPVRWVWTIDAAREAEKLRLIGCYPTQWASAVTDLADFSPRLRLQPRPHEAMWEFLPR